MSDERKREIIATAVEIIADKGYASLTMRALARASGMKLGALQYHFRTRQALMQSLIDFLVDEVRQSFAASGLQAGALSVREIADFMLQGMPSDAALDDKLWPQLWAMQQVEPLVSDLLEDVYAEYLKGLEQAIKAAGGRSPRAEALCLMSMLEGEVLFLGAGRRWAPERQTVHDAMLEMITKRYGE